jgi:hypothetical protein
VSRHATLTCNPEYRRRFDDRIRYLGVPEYQRLRRGYLIGHAGPGNQSFTASAFNGFKFLFSGVSITGATVNGSSTFVGNPPINIVGNNMLLNYSGLNTGSGATTSVIDVATPASGILSPHADAANRRIARSRAPIQTALRVDLIFRFRFSQISHAD